MNKSIFSIDIQQFKVSNWTNKKNKLLELFENSDKKKIKNVITTNYDVHCKLFEDEIKKIENEYHTNFYICQMWFQKYDITMDHAAHTHGPMGISSVCFINYDKSVHKPVTFISPFNNPLSGCPEIFQPTIEEGDIIFFPSNILHYAPVNTSEKQRIILSFNLREDIKKNMRHSPEKFKYI